jgi:hypothetical protein
MEQKNKMPWFDSSSPFFDDRLAHLRPTTTAPNQPPGPRLEEQDDAAFSSIVVAPSESVAKSDSEKSRLERAQREERVHHKVCVCVCACVLWSAVSSTIVNVCLCYRLSFLHFSSLLLLSFFLLFFLGFVVVLSLRFSILSFLNTFYPPTTF